MTVMVDELMAWPYAKGVFRRGSCHLTASTMDELHAFALRLGLRRDWFQEHALLPHYDLTPRKRAAAMAAGAVVVPMREQLQALRAGVVQLYIQKADGTKQTIDVKDLNYNHVTGVTSGSASEPIDFTLTLEEGSVATLSPGPSEKT